MFPFLIDCDNSFVRHIAPQYRIGVFGYSSLNTSKTCFIPKPFSFGCHSPSSLYSPPPRQYSYCRGCVRFSRSNLLIPLSRCAENPQKIHTCSIISNGADYLFNSMSCSALRAVSHLPPYIGNPISRYTEFDIFVRLVYNIRKEKRYESRKYLYYQKQN